MPQRAPGDGAARDGAHDRGDHTHARELDRRHVALSLRIRECERSDVEKLGWLGLLPGQRDAIDDAWARHARGEDLILVAESQGFPIALARIELARAPSPALGVIAALRVMPGLTGLGIGGALLAAAERVLRERGRAAVEIEVDGHDAREIARFARLGYQRVDGSVNGATARRARMRKWIDPLAAPPALGRTKAPMAAAGR